MREHIPVLRLGTVITRELIEHLPSYMKIVRSLNVNSWELFRPISDVTNISLKEYQRLAAHALKANASGMNIKLANGLPFCLLPNKDLAASLMLGGRSDDGHSRLVWDTKGYFKPSYFIDEPLGTDILSAWDHPLLKKIRSLSYLPEECLSCEYLQWCKGGSRAAAKKMLGSYFAPDPAM